MLYREIHKRIGDFVTEVMDDENVKVEYGYQSASRPLKPFIMITADVASFTGFAHKFGIDDDGRQKLVLDRSFSVRFEAFCDDLFKAADLLMTIQNGFSTHKADEYFGGDLVYMRTTNGVDCLRFVIDGKNESRAMMICEFNTNIELLDNVGLIEHIEITNTETGDQFIINK